MQLPFGIHFERFLFEPLEILFHFLENKTADSLEIAVEIDRAEERFKGVAEGGSALPAAARFFAAPHQQMPAEVERGRADLERFARDQTRPAGREAAFSRFAIAREEVFGNDELEDGVAEEFKPLIVELLSLPFMRHTRMSERFG